MSATTGGKMPLLTAIERIQMELNNARETARLNRESGSPVQSVAYDEGRYAGLRDALDILAQVNRS